MNGILAQTAALAAHARAGRVDRRFLGDDRYWHRHSTFQYVRTLRFTGKGPLLPTGELIVNSPADWLTALPAGAEVWLLAESPGTIVVSQQSRVTSWSATWDVVAQHPETRIWSVHYLGVAAGPVTSPATTIDQARAPLAAALRAVAAFTAVDASFSSWCELFDRAFDTLHDPAPVPRYHPDLLPDGAYSLVARQLLAACVNAYVFGGMGSWNDVVFDDPATERLYQEVTGNLFRAVHAGIEAAVNHGVAG